MSRDGAVERLDWRGIEEQARLLASALQALGLRRGDRVATLAWNTPRHLELDFAVPAIGGVLHTVNGRLSAEQVARIVRHAGDRFLFVDPELVPLVDGLVRLAIVFITAVGCPPVPARPTLPSEPKGSRSTLLDAAAWLIGDMHGGHARPGRLDCSRY